LLTTTDECEQFGNWVLNRYKYPVPRINEITIAPRQNARNKTKTWRAVLGLDLEHRIRIIVRPQLGAMIQQEAHVENLTHEITRENWLTTYSLSPADNTNYLLLDDNTLGQLDSNALAY
jgi:hypothetical protein